MNRRPLVLEKFDDIFDQYNDKKITKEQMLDCCTELYKKLPLSWRTKVEKKKGRDT